MYESVFGSDAFSMLLPSGKMAQSCQPLQYYNIDDNGRMISYFTESNVSAETESCSFVSQKPFLLYSLLLQLHLSLFLSSYIPLFMTSLSLLYTGAYPMQSDPSTPFSLSGQLPGMHPLYLSLFCHYVASCSFQGCCSFFDILIPQLVLLLFYAYSSCL